MVNAEEMARWIEELAQFGQIEGGSMWRRPYTEDDERAIGYVRERAERIGMAVRRDAAGNVIARIDGKDGAAKPIATGSHLDTVKNGGKYDGALGVLSGLAAIADVVERRGQPDRPLELLIFEGEEGNRFPGFIGSLAMIEGRTAEQFDALTDAEGVSAAQVLREVGLDPAGLPAAKRDDLGAFIELHIEQGAILEQAGKTIGLVTAIVGLRQFRITLTGQPGHAGTTPMLGRRDALQGAVEFVLETTRIVEEIGAPAVVTCGQLIPLPGAPNVIPGRVDFTLDTRDADGARLVATAERFEALAGSIARRRNLELDWRPTLSEPPTPMAPHLLDALRAAADAAGISHMAMVSGAGHDAMIVARACPAAMLFVPSRHGYSHRPDEYTPIEPIMDGVRVLAGALERLAYG